MAVMDPFDSSISPREEEAAENGDSRAPWFRFSSWLECVCVVTFDLELGQAIEVRTGVTQDPVSMLNSDLVYLVAGNRESFCYYLSLIVHYKQKTRSGDN